MTETGHGTRLSPAENLPAGGEGGKACRSCRFFDERRGGEAAVCRRHKIRTYTAGCCGEYDGRGGLREA